MWTYIIRRILIAIPILFGITIINFIIINLAPGNPVEMFIDPNVPPEVLEARKEALGLNDPLYVQYYHWLVNVLQGNLGYSFVTFQPVTDLIFERLGPTILLMISSLLFGIIVAIPMGIISAVKQYSSLDYLATGGAFLGISLPNFFLGMALIYIFALKLDLLPTGGLFTLGGDRSVGDILLHLILPTVVLGAHVAGKFIRYVRSSVLEILGHDYIRTARAKGLREFWVINKHGLRNALIPIITVIGLEIPLLMGGSVVVEQVFQWPGIGQLMISSILSRDYPTLMALNLLAAVIVVVVNLVTDIVYSIADPRIRYE